jgi:hypothetical protein
MAMSSRTRAPQRIADRLRRTAGLEAPSLPAGCSISIALQLRMFHLTLAGRIQLYSLLVPAALYNHYNKRHLMFCKAQKRSDDRRRSW